MNIVLLLAQVGSVNFSLIKDPPSVNLKTVAGNLPIQSNIGQIRTTIKALKKCG